MYPEILKRNIKETFRRSAKYCLVCLFFATSASFYTQLKAWVIELESRLKYLTNITCGSFCSLLKDYIKSYIYFISSVSLSRVLSYAIRYAMTSNPTTSAVKAAIEESAGYLVG